MSAKNAFYAQSGGVTAVINVSAAAVIETARRYPQQIKRVYGGRNGILGALLESLIDTSVESAEAIAALRYTPGAAFGSCRYKLRALEQDRATYQRLIDVFKAHEIRYFFYNGGGDSADTCLKVAHFAETVGYPLQAIHIPKTIDNDLPITDCSPGFGSAAKYVAASVREAAFDVASMAKTSTKVFILEVMGRHTGWLTAACGLAAEHEHEAPQLLLFPEVPFEEQRFLEQVQRIVERDNYCVIAASEGLCDSQGRFLSTHDNTDAFGHVQLGGVAPALAQCIHRTLGYKYHWARPDYLQRSARHLAARTDLEQAYAVGRAAVELAVNGQNAVMPTIVRLQDAPYRWEIGYAPLSAIANQEKKLPGNFLDKDGFHISPAARRYLAPLILGEDPPPFLNGLPCYRLLQNIEIPRKLAAFPIT